MHHDLSLCISHLEPSLPVVFCNAVILTGSSVEAVADTQDGIEQGARELITHPDCQLDGLRAEERPRQQAITWNREHGGHILHDIFIRVNTRDGYKATPISCDVKKTHTSYYFNVLKRCSFCYSCYFMLC